MREGKLPAVGFTSGCAQEEELSFSLLKQICALPK